MLRVNLVLLAIVLGIGCGLPKPAETGGPKEDAPLGPIDAASLSAAYVKSPAEATSKYAGKKVTVRLRVDEVEQVADYIKVSQRINNERVMFHIPVAEAERLEGKQGATIKFTGSILTASDGDILLEGHVDS
ncbi:MAG TPA: hypothetical protein VH092_04305 [Urbifossiella sp.]|jgi:hypothetical protein|nr:hypothetical protein [Urbifossiella sp.]